MIEKTSTGEELYWFTINVPKTVDVKIRKQEISKIFFILASE